ncbi:MAG: CGP-CTERM sorting domain-containing protein [Thermococci archaeon]|nr:CGP-CTERM sorting domain-containing protein [Thermococci archaeon]
MKWLNQVLASHRGYVPIILFHHPYWYKGSKGWIGGYIHGNPFNETSWKKQIVPYLSRYWYSSDNKTEQEIARQFLEDVVKYNVRLVLAGHIHHDKLHVFIDGNGTKHWFYTLTATGAPDKETNPPSVKGHAPTWYGSSLIYVYSNGTVSLKPVVNYWHGNMFGPIISLPVPQEFIVYRYHGPDGTALKFVNEYEKVSGPLVIQVPQGAKIDPSATNVKYKVLGEREIGGKYFMLLNVTVPKGTWQLVASTGKDTKKPDVVFQYMTPSSFEPKEPLQVYVQATDNVGIKDFYAQVYSNGKPVSYGKVTKFPAEPATGKWNNNMYLFDIPPLNGAKYTLKITAVDFYNNTYVLTKTLNAGQKSSSSSSASASASPSAPHPHSGSRSTGGSSSHKICGPAAIVALAILPLFLRKRR